MKKYLSIIICSFIIICISTGASKSIKTIQMQSKYKTTNNFKGVSMLVKNKTITRNGLTLVFENKTKKMCITGAFFVLEKKDQRRWVAVPVVVKCSYGFNDYAFLISSEKKTEFKVNWKWLYGTLNKGSYRIIKRALDFRKSGDFDTYMLSAEFYIAD